MKALRFLLIALLCLAFGPAYAATTLLPNGEQCFTNANGALVAGTVNMFFPATTTPKPTWKDSNQNTLNSQPIVLDSNGCAVIYGIGSYRQQVFDSLGALQWDQITTDTSAYNAVFWAGLSGGTPDVITVVDTGFNGTDGTVINFTALSTNTGATTINPSGFGAISVVKDTASGPLSLSGGEIIQNNIISVVYSATSNTFHLLNAAIPSPSGNSAPLCGASTLKITNNAGTPNSIIDITATQVLTQNPSGQVLNRTTVSTSINISTGAVTSTAGGMDGESPGTSSWLYLWLIDNGSAISALATLASGNGLTPNMPSGYTYKCRVGAMSTDGGGNLYRSIQQGQNAQWINTASQHSRVIANGVAGTYSVTSPVLAAATVEGDGFCAPLTARNIIVNGSSGYTAGALAQILAAPNTAWGGTNNGPEGSNANIWPLWINNSAAANATGAQATMVLEGTSIGWASNAAGGAIGCMGWGDNVNAN